MFRDRGFPPLSGHLLALPLGPCSWMCQCHVINLSDQTFVTVLIALGFILCNSLVALLSFNLNGMSGKKKTGTQLNKNGQEQIQLRFFFSP